MDTTTIEDQKDEFDFSDVELVEISVTAPGGLECTLREATGEVGTWFQNARMNRIKVSESGKTVVGKDVFGIEPELVSRCLFHEADDKMVMVPIRTIQSWPDRVREKLFEKILDISDLRTVDKLKELIIKAFSHSSAPTDIGSIRAYVSQLPPAYKIVKELFAESPEELAKNEQDLSMVGSE